MKSIIRWAVNSTPAMNMILLTILGLGLLAGAQLRRETFPRFELEVVLVTVPYPGASPDEVEEGICQKIEEAVRSVEGIKKITSVATENAGNVVIELKSDVENVQKVLNKIESEVDRIPSFPDLAEDPEIQQITIRNPAISLAVVSEETNDPEAELRLREIAERVRDDLLALPTISQADIVGAKQYQIDVQIDEDTLREYGLTLQQVAQILRRENLELPGGKLKTSSAEVLLRGKAKRLTGEEIAKIPLVTDRNGVVLTVGDLGTVHDEFADTTSISRVNGKPGLVIDVTSAASEDMIAMTEEVNRYVEETTPPVGYSYVTWNDQSIDVSDRLDLLYTNGFQGLVLVFLVLAAFLEIRLAFWVALGIPVSILGACAVLWFFDQTLNMLSMFSFLMALGIVVDDAIVIGENIYSHREQGKKYFRAAIDGTVEVLPSVCASIATTVVAFMPMFFVVGVMGKFFAVMPLAIIAMLLISLVESTFILPCHLAHGHEEGERKTFVQKVRARAEHFPPLFRVTLGPVAILGAFLIDFFLAPLGAVIRLFNYFNRICGGLIDGFIQNVYTPVLKGCLKAPTVVIALCLALFMFTLSLVTNGSVPWVFFPKLDARIIQAKIIYPNGTPADITDEATRQMEQTILAINDEYEEQYGSKLLEITHRMVGSIAAEDPGAAAGGVDGSHAGIVKVELVDNTKREITSQEVVSRWRERSGQFAGAETLTFGTIAMGPGGVPIEFKLLANARDMEKLEAAVEEVKAELGKYPGVFDIEDDSRPGKWEYQLTIKEEAKALGISQQALAATVRAGYYGEEVMRLQRGRHEVKLMVRYPPEQRRDIGSFDDLRIDSPEGDKLPLEELANVNVARSYSEVNRLNQRRSITVSADVDESKAVAATIIASLKGDGSDVRLIDRIAAGLGLKEIEEKPGFLPELLKKYPEVSVRWEGQQEQSNESVQSLMVGFIVALLVMFVLLTLEFNAYLQPLIIMAIIPFGAVGAIWGHLFMGLPLTLFSVLGLVALTGVVVNDSIVLVDFINARVRSGTPVEQAVLEAGQRRFRPVLLTSMTTIAGLFPILLETSFQAQLVIPMATSLSFGLLLATALVLLLVPMFYLLYAQIFGTRSPGNEDHDATSEELIERNPKELALSTT